MVNANFAVARAQLEAGRVDAALVIEPLASIIIKQNPDWHVIFNGAQGWKEITGADGWEIVRRCAPMRSRAFPNGTEDVAGRLKDVAEVLMNETARGRQDRQRDAQAAAGHSRRGSRQPNVCDMVVRAGVGSRDPQVDHRHDGAGGEGRLYTRMPDEKIIVCHRLRSIASRSGSRFLVPHSGVAAGVRRLLGGAVASRAGARDSAVRGAELCAGSPRALRTSRRATSRSRWRG